VFSYFLNTVGLIEYFEGLVTYPSICTIIVAIDTTQISIGETVTHRQYPVPAYVVFFGTCQRL